MKTPQVVAERLRGIHIAGRTLLVAIDGAGGSGKTTLSRNIAKLLAKSTVIHMDDFWKPTSEGNAAWKTFIGNEQPEKSTPWANVQEIAIDNLGGGFDFQRLQRQILEPLREGRIARYQIYDWNEDRVLEESHDVHPGGIVIIEGGTTARRELREYFDFIVWIDCDREIRLRRALARDGEHMRNCWIHKWEPEWECYVNLHQPAAQADIRLDGSAMNC